MSFSDIFKKSFLQGYSTIELGTKGIIVALCFSLVLGLYIFFCYRLLTRRTFYSKNFNISLVCMSLITTATAPVVTPEVEAPAAGSVDLTAFYQSLMDTYGENFPATMNLCESVEMLDSFYPGLSAIDTKQMMIYQPMMGAVVCEIALVEVTNSADVDAVKGMMQARIDAQVEGGAWYPESIEGWKSNSRVVTNGNCVMMIAYSECDAVVDAFNGLF